MRKKEKKEISCVVCGGKMVWDTREDVLVYEGQTKTIPSTGYWCDECEEAIFEGAELRKSERAFLELKAKVLGVLGPEEIETVRKKLGLSQRQAGELLGGGPRSFQKYEAGHQAVSKPMSNLLRILGNDPTRLKELQATRHSKQKTQ